MGTGLLWREVILGLVEEQKDQLLLWSGIYRQVVRRGICWNLMRGRNPAETLCFVEVLANSRIAACSCFTMA